MPLYRYSPEKSPCRICGDGFDHIQAPNEAPLTECPTCGKPVVRNLPTNVNTPRASRKPSVTEAKEAGFTVLKRTSGGEFEKQ